MSDREWISSTAGRAAIAALAISATLAAWTLVHAVRIEAVPALPPPSFAGGGALPASAATPDVDVAAAVETDPFAADRSAPVNAYRIPGEEGDAAVSQVAAVEPVVIGTAVSDSAHSFTTVQLADSKAVILRVGDKIGEYTVKSIERGHVVFTTPSGRKLDKPELKP